MSCGCDQKSVCDPNACFARFWMVLNDNSSIAYGHGPTFRHSSRDDADLEAQRLATKNPGVKFFVLETVAACVKSDVQWLEAADRKEIPPF